MRSDDQTFMLGVSNAKINYSIYPSSDSEILKNYIFNNNFP